MARLSLQLKNALVLIFSASTSIFAGASVRDFYEGSPFWRPAVIASLFVLCQLVLILVPSKEEEELALFREARMNKTRQRQREEEEVSNRIVEQIRSGNFESVERWQVIRKSHYEQ